MVVAYIRTVKTASKATAVQIVHSNRRGSHDIEHIGSAQTPEEVEALKAAARQRLYAGQDTLDFGDGRPEGPRNTDTTAIAHAQPIQPLRHEVGIDKGPAEDS